MYIEDIISLLVNSSFDLNDFDHKMLTSFQIQISTGYSLTYKQAKVVISILNRQKSKIEHLLSRNIDIFLENPNFKLGLREISQRKYISIRNGGPNNREIRLEFPYSEEIIKKIRDFSTTKTYGLKPAWVKEEKSWIFSLEESNLKFLLNLSKLYQFEFDDLISNLFDQIDQIEKNIDFYLPMVKLDNGLVKFHNFPEKYENTRQDDIIGSLFLAREHAIDTWDDAIDNYISVNNNFNILKEFLNTDPGEIFHLKPEKSAFFALSQIVKYMSPCLVIISGGIEQEQINKSVNFLQSTGIRNEEMSVLFRLPNKIGETFNEFIRKQKLNNPVDQNTKIIFISTKLPKLILEQKINFKMILTFNLHSHFSVKNFIKNHQNVIYASPNIFAEVTDLGNL